MRLFMLLVIGHFFLSGHLSSAKTLATVNGKTITLDYLNKHFQRRTAFSAQAAQMTKKDFLNELIKRELAIQEARRINLHREPEVKDRMNSVLYQSLIEKKLQKKFEAIHVTDKKTQDYYNRNKEVRTSHIFIPLPPNSGKKVRQKAKSRIIEIYNKHVKPGKMTFSAAAQQFSEGPSAPMGGDLGYQGPDSLDPVYYKTAVKLSQPGKVSGVIESQFGFHIVKLTGIKAWKDVDQARIKQKVIERERNRLFEQYMSGLKRKAKIEINKSATF